MYIISDEQYSMVYLYTSEHFQPSAILKYSILSTLYFFMYVFCYTLDSLNPNHNRLILSCLACRKYSFGAVECIGITFLGLYSV